MIIKFDVFEKQSYNLKENNIFLFHGPNLGRVDYCKEIVLNKKRPKNNKIDVINLHTEELKKGEFSSLYQKHCQPNIFGNSTLLNIYLNNEKLSKEIVTALSQFTLQNTVIIKSEQLPPKSVIRSLFEREKNFITVPCYEESFQEKINYVSKLFDENNISLSQEKIKFISENLPNQRLDIKNEIEKIIILIQSDGIENSLDNIDNYISDNLNIDSSSFIYSIVSARSKSFIKNYNNFSDYGNDNLKLLSYLLEHIFRMLIVKYKVEQGSSMTEAIRDLKPPVFFKHLDLFSENIKNCEINQINFIFTKLIQCKKNFIEGRLSSDYYFLTSLFRLLKPQYFS